MAVASTSSEKTDLAHSMGHSPSSSAKNPVADVKYAAADAVSDTSSVSGISATAESPEQSESSTRKDVNSQLLSSARSEEYRQLFHLPPEEVLVQDFNCAFQESILIQGHMYLFVHHICFYSNIFGYETKKVIPFQEVTCVRKAKTAAIFPNAIEIESGGRKHFFASFLSRDEAYRLIVDGWSQNNINAKALLDYQESKIDTGNQDNVLVLFEKLMNFKRPSNETDSVDRDKDADISEECNEALDTENDCGVTAELLGVLENGKEERADPLSCGEPLTWKPEDMDAPKIPNNYTMVAESKFPIQVEEFFNCFFSDGAVDFVEAFHRKCGDKDFQCTSWYEHEQDGQARDLSFQHPIKIYFGAKYGHCREVQKFRIYTNSADNSLSTSHLVIETSQQVSDVPYGDYFRVEGLWDIEQHNDEENSCFMRVFVNVSFLRKTMWKGKIEQSTMEECREAYALWINQAHERLKKRETFGKLEGVTSNAANNLLNSDNGLKSLTTLVAPSEGTTTRARLLHGTSDPKDVTAPVNDLANGYLSYAASSALLFREAWATLCLYFRSRSNISLLLGMALAAIFILMQLTIIVLLARTPKIHLIPQESLMSSFRNERAEAISWMEKRVCHLKEEMFMVEARLERMHQEYILLKSHLKSFQQFDLKS